MKKSVKNLISTGAMVLLVGGAAFGNMSIASNAGKTKPKVPTRVERAQEDFSDRIKRDLQQHGNVDIDNSSISISTLNLDNDEAQAVARGGDLLSVYGKVEQADVTNAFKMVYNTRHHMVFDYQKVLEKFKDAEFVSFAVIENEYAEVFGDDFDHPNLADEPRGKFEDSTMER